MVPLYCILSEYRKHDDFVHVLALFQHVSYHPVVPSLTCRLSLGNSLAPTRMCARASNASNMIHVLSLTHVQVYGRTVVFTCFCVLCVYVVILLSTLTTELVHDPLYPPLSLAPTPHSHTDNPSTKARAPRPASRLSLLPLAMPKYSTSRAIF